MTADREREELQALLSRLGVTQNYKGYGQIVLAVELCREEPERLLLVTKWVYPAVARRYGTSWNAVERNIRTVRRMIWERNRPLLEELACASLSRMPCPAQLLSILAFHRTMDAGPEEPDGETAGAVL